MNAVNSFLQADWAELTGWTLLHSLFQIAAVAAVYAIAAFLLRNRSANSRYVLGCVAMLAMLALPIGSYVLLSHDASREDANASHTCAATTSLVESPTPLRDLMEPAIVPADAQPPAAHNDPDPANIAASETRTTKTVRSPASPAAVVAAEPSTSDYLWAFRRYLCWANGLLCVIDLSSGRVTGKLPVGYSPRGPSLSPNGKRAYVCNRFDNSVSIVDLVAKQELARVRVLREPFDLAITPDGKALFESTEVGCATCHPTPLYTDLKMHDVKTRGPFDRRDTWDTPTLIECWRTGPYLHDGRYTTVKDVLAKGNHGDAADRLSDSQIDDLAQFVLSLSDASTDSGPSVNTAKGSLPPNSADIAVKDLPVPIPVPGDGESKEVIRDEVQLSSDDAIQAKLLPGEFKYGKQSLTVHATNDSSRHSSSRREIIPMRSLSMALRIERRDSTSVGMPSSPDRSRLDRETTEACSRCQRHRRTAKK